MLRSISRELTSLIFAAALQDGHLSVPVRWTGQVVPIPIRLLTPGGPGLAWFFCTVICPEIPMSLPEGELDIGICEAPWVILIPR